MFSLCLKISLQFFPFNFKQILTKYVIYFFIEHKYFFIKFSFYLPDNPLYNFNIKTDCKDYKKQVQPMFIAM